MADQVMVLLVVNEVVEVDIYEQQDKWTRVVLFADDVIDICMMLSGGLRCLVVATESCGVGWKVVCNSTYE